MEGLIAVVLLCLEILVWTRALAVVEQALPRAWERPAPCPGTLVDFLATRPPDCLPERSDHAAPGRARWQAPAGICLVLARTSLHPSTPLFPYVHKPKVVRRCAWH